MGCILVDVRMEEGGRVCGGFGGLNGGVNHSCYSFDDIWRSWERLVVGGWGYICAAS